MPHHNALSTTEQRVRLDAQARAQLASEGEDVSVMDVQNVMEKMQQRNREMFVVPPCISWLKPAPDLPWAPLLSPALP